MGIISDIFGKPDIAKNKPSLKEKYPYLCIETVNNREYLEWFFDVKNDSLGQPLKIMPNCPHCASTFMCAIGVHVHNHQLEIAKGNIKSISPKPEKSNECVAEISQTNNVTPKFRFNDND